LPLSALGRGDGARVLVPFLALAREWREAIARRRFAQTPSDMI